jgi:hypothetical protein
MNPDDKNAVEKTIINLVQQASIETIFDFCLIVSKHLNLKEIDGIPVDKWLSDRKFERMESVLIQLEDLDPALAAKFQKAVDESRKRTGA